MSRDKFKILWHSNAPWAPSGYGNQTDLFTRLMIQDGFEVTISAFYGLQGATLNLGGIKVLPSINHPYGEDTLIANYYAEKPDFYIALIDSWVYKPDVIRQIPLYIWAPIDHEPVPPPIATNLEHYKGVWAMSRHGEIQMRHCGVAPDYVPHGIDTDIFKPTDRTKARQELGIADNEFFIVSVAANKGYPDRKNFRAMIKGFSHLASEYDNVKMYIHAVPTEQHTGLNLEEIARTWDVSSKVSFPDVYRYLMGAYTQQWQNKLYNAADVFLLPSCGEGFGIPIVEAQAAGCPVIVTDFTAQRELVGAGYKIPITIDDIENTLLGSMQARVPGSKVYKALKLALDWKNDKGLREQAVNFAQAYDYRHVYKEYLKPAILKSVKADKEQKARQSNQTDKRLALRGGGNG